MAKDNLLKNIFILPYKKEFIIYLPLQKFAFIANKSYARLIKSAKSGDKSALNKLELTQSLIEKNNNFERLFFCDTDKSVQKDFQPSVITMFLTSECTFNCAYCYADTGEKKTKISSDIAKAAIDKIIENANQLKKEHISVSFHGGDISKEWNLFVEIVEYAKCKGNINQKKVFFSVGINGFLTPNQVKWISKNINEVTVSIDGFNHIQDIQRPLFDGSPSFKYVDRTLRIFDSLKFNYGIRSTITDLSVNELPNIVRFFCENYQTTKIKVEPMYQRGRALRSEMNSPSSSSFIKNFRKARKIALSFNKELLYSGVRLDCLMDVFCQASGNICGLTPEGWITSCYEVLNFEDPLSKVFFYGRFDHENKIFSIDEKKWQFLLNFNVHKNSKCNDCFCKWHCAGDCPAKSPILDKTDKKTLDRCKINKALTKDLLLEKFFIN